MLGSDHRQKMGQKTDLRPPALSLERDCSADAAAPHGFRRQPVILKDPARQSTRFAEVAGGKTAECAAIFCCFPFGIVDLVILALVRLPASLCRRAFRKRILLWRTKKKAKLFSSSSGDGSGGGGSSTAGSASDDDLAESTGKHSAFMIVVDDQWPERPPSAELIEVEKEMWSKFYGSGFWRSPSWREGL